MEYAAHVGSEIFLFIFYVVAVDVASEEEGERTMENGARQSSHTHTSTF